jgi:hypothetical protein
MSRRSRRVIFPERVFGRSPIRKSCPRRFSSRRAKLVVQIVVGGRALLLLQDHERRDRRSFELVGDPDDRGLRHRGVVDEDPRARDVHHVVDAAALGVSGGAGRRGISSGSSASIFSGGHCAEAPGRELVLPPIGPLVEVDRSGNQTLLTSPETLKDFHPTPPMDGESRGGKQGCNQLAYDAPDSGDSGDLRGHGPRPDRCIPGRAVPHLHPLHIDY